MLADINDLELEFWLRNRNSGNLVWKTKDNEIIPIKDLSNQHLGNILNMFTHEEIDGPSIGDLEDALG